MNLSTVFTKQHVSIFLIWLFHVSGILGIIYSNASWFVRATPLNLLLSFGVLLINLKRDQKALGLLFLCFVVGMAAEILGVRYGLIFGEYSYGAVLGPKVFEVPWLIGINWCILTFITGSIAAFFSNSFWLKTLLGVGLMLTLDLVIEPVAPVLDFWTFSEGLASVHNYVGWAFVAFPLQMGFHHWKIQIDGPFPFHLFILQFLFFTILLFKINSIGI
jgi:bisanhydrobacterioruberin hydratase